MHGDAYESLQRVSGGVSRETGERLEQLQAFFQKWARAINLVSPNTLDDVWARHILDSAQLWRLRQETRTWLDLGSGSGFPGLVTAAIGVEHGHTVTLVESNQKKSSYLRQAASTLGLPVSVRTERVEELAWGLAEPDRTVTARAFAPLARLFDWTHGLGGPSQRALLHKGRGYMAEVAEARDRWTFDLVEHPSLVDAESVILDITAVRRL